MNRKRLGLLLLVATLMLVMAVPASGHEIAGSEIQYTTQFPTTGDTVVVTNYPYWWHAGDYAQGTRTTDLTSIGQVNFNMAITNNVLNNGGHCDFTLSINGQAVGSFVVTEADQTGKNVSFTVNPPITGPNVTIRLQETNTVDPGLGSIVIPEDASTLTLSGSGGPCASEVALDQASDQVNLDMLRRFRDNMLAKNEATQKYVTLYYQHSPEVVKILLKNKDLRVRTAELLRETTPSLEALMSNQSGVVLSSARAEQIQSLLKDIAAQGSPELRSALKGLQGDIAGFSGQSFDAIWQSVSQ